MAEDITDTTERTQRASRRANLIALGAVGASCAAAGAWWASTTADPSEANRTNGPGDVVSAFWGSEFDTPKGGTLRASTLQGKPLVLNFWATWCPPCVEELPLLERFYTQNKANGWQVLAIAADQSIKVNEFLIKLPLSFAIGVAGAGAVDLSKRFGNISGGLPYTVVFASSGEIAQRKLGQVSANDIASWADIR